MKLCPVRITYNADTGKFAAGDTGRPYATLTSLLGANRNLLQTQITGV